MSWTILEGGGEGGAGGGLLIPDSATIPFATTTARDVWAAANKTDLVKDTTAVNVTGESWFVWRGETNPPPPYDNSLWVNGDELVKGQDGAKGDKGDTGDIGPVKSVDGETYDAQGNVQLDAITYKGGKIGLQDSHLDIDMARNVQIRMVTDTPSAAYSIIGNYANAQSPALFDVKFGSHSMDTWLTSMSNLKCSIDGDAGMVYTTLYPPSGHPFTVTMSTTTTPSDREFDKDVTAFVVSWNVTKSEPSETVSSGTIKVNGVSHTIDASQSSLTITQTVVHSMEGISIEGDFTSSHNRTHTANETLHFERVYVYLKADKFSITASDLDTGSRHDVSYVPNEMTISGTQAEGHFFLAILKASSNPSQYNHQNFKIMEKSQVITWKDEQMQVYRTMNKTHESSIEIEGAKFI